jgi:trehalose utilization protein
VSAETKVRVRVWSEHTARKVYYPEDINGAVAEGLRADPSLEVTTAELVDIGDGVPDDALEQTDVVIWWGHQLHRYVADDAVDRVIRHVTERGMGLVALHSAHMSKPFTRLIGDTGGIGAVALEGGSEHITVEDPTHPIAQGIGPVVLDVEESFNEPFECGKPDTVVFSSAFSNGHVFRSGLAYEIGRGRVFYFRPGHETYASLFDPNGRRIIRNAVHWAAKAS